LIELVHTRAKRSYRGGWTAISKDPKELFAVIGPHGLARTSLLHALADAFGGDPATVITIALDGPSDTPGRDLAWAELRRTADSGTTVVAASDSADAAGRYAHRVVLLPLF
jgi:ABC-type phosphate/phosphonate transport system ATPase subunit